MINTAVKAARRAAAVINRASFDLDRVIVTEKNHKDFVTDVDQAAEQAIIEVLSKAYPDHAFLGEESGASANAHDEVNTPGSSTRSMAPPTSCTASRSTASRSRCRSAA
jgi:fructose-1,6-bisphosphatase/inositol monophosphatase family enzyme